MFHPVGGLTGFLLHNGEMRHGRRWRGAMPMLLTRQDGNYISFLILLCVAV
jgi:hypothetical protein